MPFRRGLEIARDAGDPYHVLRFLGGLHILQIRLSDFIGALKVAQQARQAALALDDPATRSMVEGMLAVSYHFAGNHVASRGHNIAASSQPWVLPRETSLQLGIDHGSRIKMTLARDLWIRGHPMAACKEAWSGVEETSLLNNPYAHATSLVFSATVFFWQDDLVAAKDLVVQFVYHADRHLLSSYAAIGLGMEGILDLRQGRPRRGAPKIAEALTRLRKLRFEVLTPWFMGALAEYNAMIGCRDEALARVDAALALVTRNGDRLNIPDLLRIKGEILALDPSELNRAASCLQEAVAWARAQSAPAWELRASLSLARVRGLQGRAGDAEPVLAAAIERLDPDLAGSEYHAAVELVSRLRNMASPPATRPLLPHGIPV
jgi:hypothetical protein